MTSFLSPLTWLLRSNGAFMRFFLPAELEGHHSACAYISGRFCDFLLHRMQQGKQHDHVGALCAKQCVAMHLIRLLEFLWQGKFKKVKKAIKRSLAENYALKAIVQQGSVDDDDLFDNLMSLYTVNIRKGLISTILRVLAPYVVRHTFVSEDESVTWKYGGIARAKNMGNPFRIILEEGTVVGAATPPL